MNIDTGQQNCSGSLRRDAAAAAGLTGQPGGTTAAPAAAAPAPASAAAASAAAAPADHATTPTTTTATTATGGAKIRAKNDSNKGTTATSETTHDGGNYHNDNNNDDDDSSFVRFSKFYGDNLQSRLADAAEAHAKSFGLHPEAERYLSERIRESLRTEIDFASLVDQANAALKTHAPKTTPKEGEGKKPRRRKHAKHFPVHDVTLPNGHVVYGVPKSHAVVGGSHVKRFTKHSEDLMHVKKQGTKTKRCVFDEYESGLVAAALTYLPPEASAWKLEKALPFFFATAVKILAPLEKYVPLNKIADWSPSLKLLLEMQRRDRESGPNSVDDADAASSLDTAHMLLGQTRPILKGPGGRPLKSSKTPSFQDDDNGDDEDERGDGGTHHRTARPPPAKKQKVDGKKGAQQQNTPPAQKKQQVRLTRQLPTAATATQTEDDVVQHNAHDLYPW